MIPYCAFATGLSELSADVDEENDFPLCDKFTPVLLEGQLCYQLNVSEHISKEVSFGPNHALMLLIDNNPEKSASVLPDGNLNGAIEYFFLKYSKHVATGATDVVEISGGVGGDSARLYLHTLPGESLSSHEAAKQL